MKTKTNNNTTLKICWRGKGWGVGESEHLCVVFSMMRTLLVVFLLYIKEKGGSESLVGVFDGV